MVSRYVEANKLSWSTIANEHYKTFRTRLSHNESAFAETQKRELGDIAGKKLIHLPCNTGADTLSLARMGPKVTGADLVPENIRYAKRLATDLGSDDARFIESDVPELFIPCV